MLWLLNSSFDKNEDERDKEDEEIVKDKETDDSKVQVLCLLYMKGVPEKIEKTCKCIGPTKLKAVFKPFRTMRQMLMKVKKPVPAEKKKGVVYEIPCQDCAQSLRRRDRSDTEEAYSEHKQAVMRFDDENGIGVHVFKHNHRNAWDEATVSTLETSYWKRRVQEAINIRTKKRWT